MRTLLPLLLAGACTTPPPPTPDLSFMEGQWVHESETRGTTQEHWEALSDTSYLGSSRVMKGDALYYGEVLAMTYDQGAWTLHTRVWGEPTKAYTGQLTSPTSITFSTDASSFPQSISYTRDGEVLNVSAKGQVDGTPHEESWTLKPGSP